MIKVEYYPKEPRLYVCGHAGYAPAGEDVVCAGVSALYCTLRMHEGVVEVVGEYPPMNERRYALMAAAGREQELKLLFDTIAMGMCDIAGRYPGYVEYGEDNAYGRRSGE